MISKDKVVSMSYILKNAEGEVLDEATQADPFYYMHGRGQIVLGLESAMEGLKVGDKKDVTVPPADGYGEMDENLNISVKRSQFPKDADIEVGMQFLAEMGGGAKHPFVVREIKGDDIFLDGNHPLAGQTLHFSIEVHGIREATQEEIEHGHAHGPDGHHHH